MRQGYALPSVRSRSHVAVKPVSPQVSEMGSDGGKGNMRATKVRHDSVHSACAGISGSTTPGRGFGAWYREERKREQYLQVNSCRTFVPSCFDAAAAISFYGLIFALGERSHGICVVSELKDSGGALSAGALLT